MTDSHVAQLFSRIVGEDDNDREYIARLRHWAKVAGVDDVNAISQSIWETGDLTSIRYVRDKNPVGLGITGDDVAQPFTITTYDEAARLTVQAIYAMVAKQWHPSVPIPPQAKAWMDRIWLNKVQDPAYPAGVSRVRDQNLIYAGNRATWAVDPNYMGHVKRMNSYVPNIPPQETSMAITFGKVPHPHYQDRPIWKAEGSGQNNLGRRTVKGVVYHRILGSLWGTDGYFRNPGVSALTDYGVGVTAQDGASNDGVILRWNNPLGLQSGWASGSYSASHAYGDGAKFVNKYGVNAINRDQASIEISGFQNTAVSSKAKLAIAGLSAYWADQYGIPWNEYPISPQDGFSFVRWHEEFGPDNGTKKCPFDAVKDITDELIEMTAKIMKQYQAGEYTEPETPAPPDYVAPSTYPWLAPEVAAEGKMRKIGNTKVFYVPQVFTVQKETPRKAATGKNTEVVGPPLQKGEQFRADYAYRASDEQGNRTTVILTPYGTRVMARDLLPRVSISAAGTITIKQE